MRAVTGQEAKAMADDLVENLRKSADDDKNFVLTPELARKLAIILEYLMQNEDSVVE